MSKDIIVLIPSGRRVKVQCTADTSILQILEDVCMKQGIPASDYDLKHHNHVLDLTTTIRFCNLPNKALLEMVEAEKKREESNVTIGLTINDGERITGDFSPNTSLFDIITLLAPNELLSLCNPTILYMRQEVVGVDALKEKSLRQLGLIKGRAIIRLLDKTEPTQANVSSVYRRVQSVKSHDSPSSNAVQEITISENSDYKDNNVPGPSKSLGEKDLLNQFDPVKQILKERKDHLKSNVINSENIVLAPDTDNKHEQLIQPQLIPESIENTMTQEILERRLRIEEEVTFVGSQKAVAFMQPEENEDELSDLPDDFYELTIEEVRKIYRNLQQCCVDLENAPMLTSAKREELDQASHLKLKKYKNVVVRIQFPDNIILQGVFTPSNTIEDVQTFLKEHLQEPNRPFHIFTTPVKELLDPKTTLFDAKFVPCVHMHFKWLEDNPSQIYLKKEIYSNKTTSDAARILASKYRAPSRRKLDEPYSTENIQNVSSTSKESKVPKWFKK